MRQRKLTAIVITYKAGMYLNSVVGKIIEGKEKDNLDLVSEADKEANKIIVSSLKNNFPADEILSEELQDEEKSATGFRWIIDPLDGTHNFLAGFREFGVLLALERSGEVILGVCYFPLLNEFFMAEKNVGAFVNGQKIKVSGAPDVRGQMFISDGILRKKPKEILKDIENFCAAGCRLRVFGSSPFAFTRVALGQAAIATNRLGKPWDIAAPALTVEEAGGVVTDEKGRPWSVNSENIIATNGALHEQALKIFNK